jgi:hypothetical protein
MLTFSSAFLIVGSVMAAGAILFQKQDTRRDTLLSSLRARPALCNNAPDASPTRLSGHVHWYFEDGSHVTSSCGCYVTE